MEAEESSYIAAKLLCGLKEAYTFKELEELLGIPGQALWRYTSCLLYTSPSPRD